MQIFSDLEIIPRLNVYCDWTIYKKILLKQNTTKNCLQNMVSLIVHFILTYERNLLLFINKIKMKKCTKKNIV